METPRPDHETMREWLDPEAAASLAGEEQSLLSEHLATCEGCRREREELVGLDRLLRTSAVPVRPHFREQVMASLPVAPWEAPAPHAWRFPVAVAVLLAVVATLCVGASGAAPAGLSTLSALGGMLRAAVLAGAGLLGASWKGIGLVVEELLSSPVSLGAFGFLVLCLNLLLVSLIWRRRPAAAMRENRKG